MGLFSKNKQHDIENEMELMNQAAERNEAAKANAAASAGATENSGNTAEAPETEETHTVINDDGIEVAEGEGETPELLNKYKDKVVFHFTKKDSLPLNSLERGAITKEEFLEEVDRYISRFSISDEGKAEVKDAFSRFIWSYDIVDELIDDDSISDIKIYNYDHIRVKRYGKREDSPVRFRNEEHFKQFVEHTAVKNKVSISDMNAAQNFVDKTNSDKAILRFNITTRLINSSELPVLHIRKIPKTKLTTKELIDLGFFSQEQVDILTDKVVNSDGILIAGKGAAGKTTFLNWLIDRIPHDNSVLVIQENEELFSDHPDMMFQHTVLNRGEGKIEYNLQDLARNGLLTDLDYFIIGEVKGGEALYLLNAAYTGHKCIATVHGTSSTEALDKLADYVKYASDYTKEEAIQMLIHFNTVVFMKDFHVQEISEIVRYDEERKNLVYDTKIFDKDGTVTEIPAPPAKGEVRDLLHKKPVTDQDK